MTLKIDFLRLDHDFSCTTYLHLFCSSLVKIKPPGKQKVVFYCNSETFNTTECSVVSGPRYETTVTNFISTPRIEPGIPRVHDHLTTVPWEK